MVVLLERAVRGAARPRQHRLVRQVRSRGMDAAGSTRSNALVDRLSADASGRM